LKVFLDTNVLISAIATRGLSADVFRLVLDKHDLVTAEPVLTELERVLKEKFAMRSATVAGIIRFLRRFPVEPKPSTPGLVRISDPDDMWILEAAMKAGADVLITGDAAFLAISNQVESPRILSPRDFWELHRGAAS
jgi:uncharacterized protein